MPNFLTDEDKQNDVIENFANFSTYFRGFEQNRKNMYSLEEKSTAIAYRCVNQNLPKFLDNAKTFEKYKDSVSKIWLDEIDEAFEFINGIKSRDIFYVDYFSFVLSQRGIDKYNSIIGGYTMSDGRKIQGLNEKINLYNQTVTKEHKIPKFKMLFKQILSDRESVSFIPEKFENDNEVLHAINIYFSEKLDIGKIADIFKDFNAYDNDKIYISAGAPVTDISKKLFGDWSLIEEAWNNEYDAEHIKKNPKNYEAYCEKRKAEFKANKSFSISVLQSLCEKITSAEVNYDGSIKEYYCTAVSDMTDKIVKLCSEADTLLTTPYEFKKHLSVNEEAVSKIKNLLDAVKDLERLLKSLEGNGEESDKDELFYGEFSEAYAPFKDMDKLYDKVRNYITQKPYSNNKIKLNFGNPQLLGGWDKNKEPDYRCVLLTKDDNFYLAVMNKSSNKIFIDYPQTENSNDCYRKIDYKLLPGPNKMLPKVFFANSNINYYAPNEKILRIRKKESFKKGDNFNIDDCHELIDFFKASIEKHPDWRDFGFKFKDTNDYKDIGEFYNDVKNQGYSIKLQNVDSSYIDEKVDSGQLYLFQIYNKDFSKNKKAVGTDNLHTMYFKMLFNEENLKNVVYKLNGEAEMFYRRKSINDDEKIVHQANQPIENKNPLSENKTTTFDYDIIKDRRYTEDKFMLHIPITMNFQAPGIKNINEKVRRAIVESKENYVIGIDRGERNLIYVCVINSRGEIVEQFSLNEIVNEYKGKTYKTDYNSALEKRSAEMTSSRKNWTQIESIKELKEGYISQVVRKICNLVKKYDAVIAMENLNSGFKNSRKKVEKQVYQKFEKMLIDKLNYMVDKKDGIDELGGLLNAYQLTNKFESFEKMTVQNGFIFYIPAWLTSKIDPSTGFTNLLDTRYRNVEASKSFISSFDDIRYNAQDEYFEFDMDYTKFPKGVTSYKKKWTLCSYGDRVKTYRSLEHNNQFVDEDISLTDEFINLFNEYGVDYKNEALKESILSLNEKNFFKKLMKLIGLTTHMRNSKTSDTTVDYIISPVKNSDGYFYDSRKAGNNLPQDADANGAYNIARKAMWAIEKFKEADFEDVPKVKISIKNSEWLEYAQK